MKYVLITHDKLKFIIDDENYMAFLKAIENNDKAFVIKKYKAVVPLHITPTIIPLEVWYPQENQRLALTHHRLCKKCLSIMHIQDKCSCWEETGKDEDKNAFIQKLPDSVTEAVNEIANKKTFPQLDKFEKAEVEEQEKKLRLANANKAICEQEGVYIDPETGERFYS